MQHYTVFEVATMLNVNPETVRRWVRTNTLHGTLSARKDGFVIDEQALVEFAVKRPKYLLQLEKCGLVDHCDSHRPGTAVLRTALRDLKKDLGDICKRIDEIEKLLGEL